MTDDARHLEQLSAYLDGELSAAERAEVEVLLARDESARRLLEELRRTAQLVGDLPRSIAPSRFADEVTARLEREALIGIEGDTRPVTFSVWRRVFAAAASLAIVVTAGWFFLPVPPKTGMIDNQLALGSKDAPRGYSDSPERLALAEPERESTATRKLEQVATRAEKGTPPADTAAPASFARSRTQPPSSSLSTTESLALRPDEQKKDAPPMAGAAGISAVEEDGDSIRTQSITLSDEASLTAPKPVATAPMALQQAAITTRPTTSQPTSQPATSQPATTQPQPTTRPANTTPQPATTQSQR